MTRIRFPVICALFAVFVSLQTGVQSQVWTQPERARTEHSGFSLQGEYRGKLQLQEQPAPAGAQVIARGNESFDLILYPGGLPGQGWNGQDRYKLPSKQQDNRFVFEADQKRPFTRAILRNGRIALNNSNGRTIGKLKKVKRTSPTLGQTPPENAVVLFDGTKETLTKHWQDGAKMTDDELLTEGATSKDTFRDARIHLEFRLPFKPKADGQARGNSGFYIQGRYEIQMLDSFGLKPRNNQCGGIYGVRPPNINMTFPPLTWQTYDVMFHAAEYDGDRKTEPARMTVKHNGVTIHKNVPVKKATRAAPKKENPEPGPLYLQDHNNPVRYRNIWVVPLDQ